MKRIYLILLPLFFVLTCSAQNGNNAEFQIKHGFLVDSENPKLTLDLEVMLKATMVNNKIQSITIVENKLFCLFALDNYLVVV